MEPTSKRVRWGTLSVLEFRVGYNASTVPESGGPPVGLIGRPTRHSYSMIPESSDKEDNDSESEDSRDSDAEMASHRTRSHNELWLDPVERARILVEAHAFPMEDIALICQDVRATLDARAFSQLDPTEKMLEVSRIQDVRTLRLALSDTREKVLLY